MRHTLLHNKHDIGGVSEAVEDYRASYNKTVPIMSGSSQGTLPDHARANGNS
jgi:hypothetical protein